MVAGNPFGAGKGPKDVPPGLVQLNAPPVESHLTGVTARGAEGSKSRLLAWGSTGGVREGRPSIVHRQLAAADAASSGKGQVRRTLKPGARRLGRTLNMGRSLKKASGQGTGDDLPCQ